MTDAEWVVVQPLLPVPGWMQGQGGQPEAYCHGAMLNAIGHLVDNGIKWRAMPAYFPPWDRVHAQSRSEPFSRIPISGCGARKKMRFSLSSPRPMISVPPSTVRGAQALLQVQVVAFPQQAAVDGGPEIRLRSR
ncbi:transposase [Streptomyces sp. NPDC056400]|uniref:transposase n=1 Tax=Streptomyces sp. NPDC056400 TaxID=3345808 RepID=UPI0035D96554